MARSARWWRRGSWPSVPAVVGLLLRAEAEAALLMVGTMTGIIMATVMNNGGGAWDNGKKYIEAGFLIDPDGTVQGKQSLAHAAAVVGDTVGDPFKDTAGPASTSSSSYWRRSRWSSPHSSCS